MKVKSNKVFARYKFLQKIQREGKSFEQFLTDPDEIVRDRVVIGCHFY